nr:leucine-rich repeat-containing protein 15-like [Drosophila kikkawai]
MNIIFILLLATAFIPGMAKSEGSCNGDNCNSTATDATSSDEWMMVSSVVETLQMDGCSNLAILELTPSLLTLQISNCSWYSINISEFSAVANLKTLEMRGGRLVKLLSDQFVELPHLEILDLQKNKIRVVFEDTFKGLSQLWMLCLNSNRLITLQENLFSPLPELSHLDLSDNNINGLPEGIFANNPKLQVICLRGGSFLSLSPKVLGPLKNLIFVDLSNNYLRNLQLPSSESIRLENSGMHELRIGKVSRLQARDNYLDYLNIKDKAAVTELCLHENSLETGAISDALQGMWRLQRLDISKNRMKELPIFTKEMLGEVFVLPNLRFVNMSKNILKHLRADSPILSPSLIYLDLSDNKIRSIEPHTFSMASNLQSLLMQGNQLLYFQYELFHHQQRSLKEVALYGNEFRPEIYEKITKYFANAGVLVLEKNQEASSKINRSNNDTFQAKMLIGRLHPKRQRIEVHRQPADQRIFKKLSTWNILILFSLMVALTLNAILVIKHLRSRGKRAWRRKYSTKI